MTCAELIELLQEQPGEREVYLDDHAHGHRPVNSANVEKYDGGYSGPLVLLLVPA